MKIKTSYSQNSTYSMCPMHWYKLYREKVKSPLEGASLYFGSAIDAGVMSMLEGNKDYLGVFNREWRQQFNFGKKTQVFDSDNISYGYADFDKDLLESDDYDKINKWLSELGFTKSGEIKSEEDILNIFSSAVKDKKNPYKSISKMELKLFNRMSWLSLGRKGEILLKSFEEQFLPRITKVVSTQTRADIKDGVTGDAIIGYIDMVLEIEGYDKPIIFDLKTAARPYTQEQIDLTAQLTLYAAMESEKHNTDLVGYVILCKQIKKEEEYICKKCGNKREGRHKTCEKMIDGTRCNGEWDKNKKLVPEVQVLIKRKTRDEIDNLLADYSNIIHAMKNEIVYKNTDRCSNWYGSPCQYYNACHNGDYTGLVKK